MPQLNVLHRFFRADTDPAADGRPDPRGLERGFAAAAAVFGGEAPMALRRLLGHDQGHSSMEDLVRDANAEVSALDSARQHIGIHEEVIVLDRDRQPVRWARVGEPLTRGESIGVSSRSVLEYGSGRSGVRLVEQLADPAEAAKIGGSVDFVDIGYWRVDNDLDPVTNPPWLDLIREDEEDDPHISARNRLGAAIHALSCVGFRAT